MHLESLKNDIKISVIIPTFNSEKYLKRCTDSLMNQTYRDIEVIVVDRGSTDNTVNILSNYDDVRLKFYIYGDERTSQFNYGVEKSTGKYLYYIGSDFELPLNLIEKAIEKLISDNSDAVIIPNFSAETSFWAICHALEKKTYVGDNLIEVARFFKKDLYVKAGGYNNNFVAYEEHDLWNRMLKLGIKFSRIYGIGELHLGEASSLKQIIKKSYYYGSTFKNYIDRYPAKFVRQIFPVRPSYIRKFRVLIKDPLHLFGLIIMKFFIYTAGFLGLAVSYVIFYRDKFIKNNISL